MSDLPRRNGWTLAERPGDRTPDRMQRLLSRAVWDAAAVIRAVRRFAVAGLDQAARDGGRRGLVVGAIDETSQVLGGVPLVQRSEEHTSELQSLRHLVCRLLLE